MLRFLLVATAVILLHHLLPYRALAFSAKPPAVSSSSSSSRSTNRGSRFNYFAFGSNMAPWVMTSLRGIPIRNGTAAVLPDYRLAFNVGGSAASLKYSPGDCVHGVLYCDLQADEFARIGWTEGVPVVYQWERCEVIPYSTTAAGSADDGTNDAGQQALALYRSSQKKKNSTTSTTTTPEAAITTVSAFTLTTLTGSKKAVLEQRNSTSRGYTYYVSDNPTSVAYLRILQQGAAYWKLDRSYQISLSKVKTTTAALGWSPTRLLEKILSNITPLIRER